MKDRGHPLASIGWHFDNEIQVAWLESNPEVREENIKPLESISSSCRAASVSRCSRAGGS